MLKKYENFIKKSCLTASFFMAIFGIQSLQASCSSTATQTLTINVNASSSIAVSGNPNTLIVSCIDPTTGQSSWTDSSTTYDVATNLADQQITAQLDSNLPTGLTLRLNMVAPPGGATNTPIFLDNTSQSVVAGISNVSATGLAIYYTLYGTATTPVGTYTRTVTLTIGS